MKARRGMALGEMLLAVLLLFISSYVFLTVFRSSYELANMTRNRAVAMILARSLLCEVECHRFGAPAPAAWEREDETPCHIVTDGKPVEMRFKKHFRYLNGSFVGKDANLKQDVVTILITWEEASGDTQGGRPPTQGAGSKRLEVSVPVWR